ncbi:SIR2 family protein, partial [Streptococcus pneumoniae]|nr:SIR2 family protein [Streptococcus pneumoniae]
NKNGKLQFGDVLHIHGTPDCDVKYFVSSSADYSKTYLKNRENFENLVTWFKETKPTVLFIGAGLEEDEILSLLCKDSKN